MESIMEKRTGKMWIWFLTKSSVYRGVVLVITAMVFVVWFSFKLMAPTVALPTTTSHEIYLPANFEVVKSVTNNIVTHGLFSSSVGIAVVQVEKDFSEYKQTEGKSQLNFLKFSTTNNKVRLDYWSIRQSPALVVHTQAFIEAIPVDNWNFLVPVDMKLLDGKLSVERKVAASDDVLVIVFLMVILFTAIGYLINLYISKILKLIYRNKLRLKF